MTRNPFVGARFIAPFSAKVVGAQFIVPSSAKVGGARFLGPSRAGVPSLRAIPIFALALLFFAACPAHAQDAQTQPAKTPYPAMAPLQQYLMDRNDEIQMARSSAPPALSADAEVLVLTAHGYETAAAGKNGFVCMVDRGWTAGINDPDFWNPKSRGPMCLNAAAARFYLPRTFKKAELAIAGRNRTQIFEAISAALDKKELPSPEPGAMCFMLSKQGYLGDEAGGPWVPHLMFFTPTADGKGWGADVPGSPVIAVQSPEEHLTIFLVPVRRWSDGTPALPSTSH
jgi:hypothetical protein